MKKTFIKFLIFSLIALIGMNSAGILIFADSKINEKSMLIKENEMDSSKSTADTDQNEKNVTKNTEAQYVFDQATQTLTISSGDIANPNSFSTYQSTPVKKIVFTGPVNLIGNCSYLFGAADVPTKLEDIEGLENVDTSQVTNMKGMFSYSESLDNVNISHFNTNQVTDMSWMFNDCKKLSNIDVSNFNTSQVFDMSYMFNGVQTLKKLDVSNFDTTQVKNMVYMFSNMINIESLDLSSFDMSKLDAQAVDSMFSNLSNLKKLVLGEKCNFYSNGDLPALSVSGYYTGYWRNIGEGDEEHPLGDFRFNSGQLMSLYDGSIMADIYVREALPIITLRNSTIYTGDSWKPEDNFISVEDIDGTYVSFDKVVVDSSKVDTTTPGVYEVIYRYGGSIEVARVTVKQNKTAVNVHDSIIYTGDTWEAKENFDSALDKDGKDVPFESITVSGNVDSTKEGSYDVEYSYGGVKSKAKIIVKNRQSAINVTLPTKMLFSVKEATEKKVESEIYKIKNNSTKDIEISIDEDSFNCKGGSLSYLEKSDPTPTQIENKIRLYLNIGDIQVQLANKSEKMNFKLGKGMSVDTYLSGNYFGEVQKGVEKQETGVSLILKITAI